MSQQDRGITFPDPNGIQLFPDGWKFDGSEYFSHEEKTPFGTALFELSNNAPVYEDQEPAFLFQDGKLTRGSAKDFDAAGHYDVLLTMLDMHPQTIAGISNVMTATLVFPDYGKITINMHGRVIKNTTIESGFYRGTSDRWQIPVKLLEGEDSESEEIEEGALFIAKEDLEAVLPGLRFRFGARPQPTETPEE